MGLSIPESIPDSPMEAAIAYANAGWYVLPVRRGKKNPGSYLGEHWHLQSTRDIAQIVDWWAGSQVELDIALHVGRSGAIVLDIDDPGSVPEGMQESLKLNPRPFQSTRLNRAGRGHYIYLQPPGRQLGNSKGQFRGMWGEVRGHNGVIIAEPSTHEKILIGGRYKWVVSGEVPVLPEDIANKLPDVQAAATPADAIEVAAFKDTFTRPQSGGEIGPISRFNKAVEQGSSRHDAAVGSAIWIAKEARAGLLDAPAAFAMLREAFIISVTDRSVTSRDLRTPLTAASEWQNIEAWSIAQAMSMSDAAVEEVAAIANRGSGDVDENVDVDPADEFWSARPELAHIKLAAESRMVAPFALLAAVLARVVAEVDPSVQIPPLVGGPASLNVFFLILGGSGQGKGASESLAKEMLPWCHTQVSSPGSGEGITHAYRVRKKGQLEWLAKKVLFVTSEIDVLTSLNGRQGSTLLPQLRAAWSGEGLGFQYANPEKNIPLPSHSYRLCFIVHAQPKRVGGLLDDADGGTPQRFMWFSAVNPHAPQIRPDFPGPLDWHLGNGFRPGPMPLPSEVESFVLEHRQELLTTGQTSLDAHAPLARIKAACALALLAGRFEVNIEDWQLSQILMDVSYASRTSAVQAIAAERRERNETAAFAEAERKIIIKRRLREEDEALLISTIFRAVDKTDGTLNDIERRVPRSQHDMLEPTLFTMVDSKQLVFDGTRFTRK